jgi:predicted nucleotidyltransferase
MINEIVESIRKWKTQVNSEIEIGDVYLFGSTIYREGITFQPDISDLDIIVLIPEQHNTAVKRRDWIKQLKKHKAILEREMVFLMNKGHTDKEVISLVPITQLELNHDIHKGGARNFFRTNEFLNVDSGKIVEGKELVQYVDLSNELATQVFEAVQKKRNAYLKITASRDEQVLTVKMENTDPLPKELAREAAKVNAIIRSIQQPGDQFSLPFGTDFLRTYLFQNLINNKELEQLYFWVDARSGGRSKVDNKNVLDQDLHLFFYEILFEVAVQEINKIIAERQNTEKSDEIILEQLSLNSAFSKFLDSAELLTKAHSNKENIFLSDIYIHPDLSAYDSTRTSTTVENSDTVIKDFLIHPRIVIAGENQSGKTALCKVIYKSLREKKLVPVYVCDKSNNYLGSILNKIESGFKEQYSGAVDFNSISGDFADIDHRISLQADHLISEQIDQVISLQIDHLFS